MTTNDLKNLIDILRTQSNASVDFCLTKLDILVAIYINPRLTVIEYAEMLDLPESSMGRHIRELRKGKTGKARPVVGLGLIDAAPNPDDWRKYEIFLTRKGELLIEQIKSIGR